MQEHSEIKVNILTDEQNESLVKAFKIGYFKELFKQKLISAEQFDYLMKLQNDRPAENV